MKKCLIYVAVLLTASLCVFLCSCGTINEQNNRHENAVGGSCTDDETNVGEMLEDAEQADALEQNVTFPLETQSTENEQSETEQNDTKPSRTEPTITGPIETVPAETVPMETEPIETIPSEEGRSDEFPLV